MLAQEASHNDVNEMLKTALASWAAKSRAYGPMFSKLGAGAHEVIGAALDEMRVLKPGMFDWWWANEHMRFAGKCKQREMSVVHEVMHYFLTDLARGRLEAKEAKETTRTPAGVSGQPKIENGHKASGKKSRA